MEGVTRILLIDDDQVDRASVRRALSKSGLLHDLTEAPDGTSGLAVARAHAFDCVLLDYRLPDVDTFELLTQLLAPDGGQQAVLMLTGEADQHIAVRLMRAGALDYLAKDEVTPSSLARAIRYAKARRSFVTELETARRDAEGKSLELDTLNKQKNILFSVVAHDLRNPFQSLLGLSTILSRAVASRDHASIERRAQGIREAASHAHALMESLFAWASVQMDTLAVNMADVELAALVAETIAGARETAIDKGITLHASALDFCVHANPDMLATVLRNLVSNAIKFTLPGGSITIAAAPRLDGAVEISVSDTGVGMAPNTIDDLFRLDRRITTHGTAGERGSGLGLLLCRDLLSRQGGELTVSSTIGLGTTFRFAMGCVVPAVPEAVVQ